MKDLYSPANPVTLTRTVMIDRIGVFRLARRSAELKSVMIINPGAWARIKVCDGKNRQLVEVPSTFTGSFQIGCECVDGIVVHIQASGTPNLSISWREPDREIV